MGQPQFYAGGDGRSQVWRETHTIVHGSRKWCFWCCYTTHGSWCWRHYPGHWVAVCVTRRCGPSSRHRKSSSGQLRNYKNSVLSQVCLVLHESSKLTKKASSTQAMYSGYMNEQLLFIPHQWILLFARWMVSLEVNSKYYSSSEQPMRQNCAARV